VYGDLADEQERYDFKRKNAKELMEQQAIAFYERQKSTLSFSTKLKSCL
jgi:hypothetical protein